MPRLSTLAAGRIMMAVKWAVKGKHLIPVIKCSILLLINGRQTGVLLRARAADNPEQATKATFRQNARHCA